MENNQIIVSDEAVLSKIMLLRGKKVMLDTDLAELYGATTKRLNEQVKRNLLRFPADFMFQLTQEEKSEVVAFCDHLRKLKFSSTLPYAFTEHGAVMLASVLNSERAIAVNIQIVRVFIKMRELLITNKELLKRLEQMEGRVSGQDDQIGRLYNFIKNFLEEMPEPRQPIGFK